MLKGKILWMECDLITITLFSMITYIQGYGIDLATLSLQKCNSSKRILVNKWTALFKIALQYQHQYCKYLP